MAGFLQASPAAGPFLALPAAQRDAFMRAVTHKLRSYVDDDGAAVSQENRILTATKP
jgi:hypothetical protein